MRKNTGGSQNCEIQSKITGCSGVTMRWSCEESSGITGKAPRWAEGAAAAVQIAARGSCWKTVKERKGMLGSDTEGGGRYKLDLTEGCKGFLIHCCVPLCAVFSMAPSGGACSGTSAAGFYGPQECGSSLTEAWDLKDYMLSPRLLGKHPVEINFFSDASRTQTQQLYFQ